MLPARSPPRAADHHHAQSRPGTGCTQPHTSPSSVVIRIPESIAPPADIDPLIFGIRCRRLGAFHPSALLHPKRAAAVPVSHRCPGSTASPEWQQSAPVS